MEVSQEEDINISFIIAEVLNKGYQLTKERIKKISYSMDWEDGMPQVSSQSSLYDLANSNIQPVSTQVMELETYEESLDSVDFQERQLSLIKHTDYLLNYMLDSETVSASLMKTGKDKESEIFCRPNEYKIYRDKQKNISTDVMATFNYLLGLREVEYEQKEIEGVDYSAYTGVIDDEKVLVIWRHDASEVEDYGTEREEFDVEDYDHIYVNGDSAISGAKLISSAFKQKMFGGE